ncbi:hypothetical protein [Spirosoma flavus]
MAWSKKFILINLLLFIAVCAGIIWAGSRSSQAAMPTHQTSRERFLDDAREVKSVYAQLSQGISNDVPGQLTNPRKILEHRLETMNEGYSSTDKFGPIAKHFTHNYERLISLHEVTSGGQENLGVRKDSLLSRIRKAQAEAQELEKTLRTQ